ncbi:19666_t:CDS:2 [Gigaspora rosea]|nr:19666_t:CDS:2 [Gigaspora rosea]
MGRFDASRSKCDNTITRYEITIFIGCHFALFLSPTSTRSTLNFSIIWADLTQVDLNEIIQ